VTTHLAPMLISPRSCGANPDISGLLCFIPSAALLKVVVKGDRTGELASWSQEREVSIEHPASAKGASARF
jgi:hypothetical protein